MGPKQFLLGGYPANETDIRPDTGYQKRPDIRCNPIHFSFFLLILHVN